MMLREKTHWRNNFEDCMSNGIWL